MQENYVQPVLTFAGKATEVVQGSLGVGLDYDAMVLIQEMEFSDDAAYSEGA